MEAGVERERECRHQHPQGGTEILRSAYPAAGEAVLAAGNAHPPMGLRVNCRRVQPEEYEARLAGQGIAARRYGGQAILLENPLPVERLAGFGTGEVSVQDPGAQRAAHCLDLQSGQRVLDACAAPGGKSAHILELADVALTALDIDAARARRIPPHLG